MAIENHFIHYSAIHLSRREDILIHSIISLYNSKDGFKWIHKNDNNTAVVIVGSELKAITDSGTDPFSTIKKEQVVCILGDIFYPKNARAVVRLDLPIKALQLVERLADIERNYIHSPLSIGYIAANQLVRANNSLQKETAESVDNLVGPDGTIDFFSNKSAINSSELLKDHENIGSQEIPMVAPTIIAPLQEEFIPANVPEQEKPFSDDLVRADLESLDLEFGSKTKQDDETRNFSLELVEKVAISDVEADFPHPVVTDELVVKAPIKEATTSLSASRLIEQIEFQEGITLVPPTLTDVATSELIMPVMKVPTENLQLVSYLSSKGVDTHLFASESNQEELEIPAEKPAREEAPQVVSIETNETDVIQQNKETKASVADNTLQLLDQNAESVDVIDSKRIKLLRWPKSELIQRHPGNAILASMVINVPMSVGDMAKQSDLPLQICQRFFDAVIESKVAEYVDQIKIEQPTLPVEPTINKEVSQRKGILYRIRAALGLLRK